MSNPRRILPGRSYLLTRRCLQRLFLLRPSPVVNRIIAYCLAEAAARFEIELIAWAMMSNHYHAVVRDPHARLPAFLERFHKMVAKCMNALYSRSENFWSTEETCVTLLPTPRDVLDKVVYTLTNPVAANLVERAAEWPGLSSIDSLDGETSTEERPKVYFSGKNSVMPASVTLRATCPTKNRAEWAKTVREAVAARERFCRTQRKKKKQKVLGRAAVLATRISDRPRKAERKKKLRPAVASREREVYKRERAALVGFRAEYRSVLQTFLERKKKRSIRLALADDDALFPPGTYRMRLWGARCRRGAAT
jgi:putative transposase